MLVLSRQKDENIIIGDDIVVTVVDIRRDKVRLGIDCPTEIPVHRREVYEAIQNENKRASRLETTAQQSTPVQQNPIQPKPVQETQYQQFVKYLHEGEFEKAGILYVQDKRDFEASHQEQDKLIKGLYEIVQSR